MKKQSTPPDNAAFDPPVHMTDDGRLIHVSIDLPGINEEQIRIDIEKTRFTLSVSRDGSTCQKVIAVKKGVRFFKKKFYNGVLEIFLEKTVPESPQVKT